MDSGPGSIPEQIFTSFFPIIYKMIHDLGLVFNDSCREPATNCNLQSYLHIPPVQAMMQNNFCKGQPFSADSAGSLPGF